MDDRVALGLELLATFADESLTLATVVDRLEAVSTDRRVVRTILERAEAEGLIDREDATVTVASTPSAGGRSEVVSVRGDLTCRRCGTAIGEGYLLRLETGELGPYGSTCIRRVTGRD